MEEATCILHNERFFTSASKGLALMKASGVLHNVWYLRKQATPIFVMKRLFTYIVLRCTNNFLERKKNRTASFHEVDF